MLALPIPAQNYVGMASGKTGVLFLAELPPVVLRGEGPEGPTAKVSKFDLKTRKVTPFIPAANNFVLSFNGEKALYELHDKWFIVPTAKEPKPTDGALKMDNMEVYEEPHAMWAQMYNEVWRIERDFFYDAGFNGLTLAPAAKTVARPGRRFARVRSAVTGRRNPRCRCRKSRPPSCPRAWAWIPWRARSE